MSNTGFLNADSRPARKPTNSSGVESKEFVYGKASSLAERRMQPSELLTVKESSGRILYVEDDEDTRELVTCVMKMNNYRIATAENCHEALMLARSNEFDLYLIDNWIAEYSGIDLCEKLREFDPFVPILFCSGAAYEHDKQRAFAAGAQGYLVKPVDNG